MQKHTFTIIAVSLLVIFAIATRVMPHEPNMTAITALAVVGSLYFSKRAAVLLPILALLLSDMFVGFYDWKLMLAVYGSFVLIGIMSWILRKYPGIVPVGVSLVGASLLFFFITNTAVWFFSPWYEQSISGLLYAYELGLPFWRNMFLGDVLYATTLIGACEAGLALMRIVQSSAKDHYTNPPHTCGLVNGS